MTITKFLKLVSDYQLLKKDSPAWMSVSVHGYMLLDNTALRRIQCLYWIWGDIQLCYVSGCTQRETCLTALPLDNSALMNSGRRLNGDGPRWSLKVSQIRTVLRQCGTPVANILSLGLVS
jgi:hypothetical protein